MQLYLLPTGVVWRSGVATNLCSRGGGTDSTEGEESGYERAQCAAP